MNASGQETNDIRVTSTDKNWHLPELWSDRVLAPEVDLPQSRSTASEESKALNKDTSSRDIHHPTSTTILDGLARASMHPMLHDRSQFPIASPNSYFPHLQRQSAAAGFTPGMSVVQRSYLPLSESYAQNLIQISHFPHLLRPSMQYPGYLSPLGMGREAVTAGRGILPLAAQMVQSGHRRMPPNAAGDPFQRSPRSESRASWPIRGTRQQQSPPVQHPYKDHRSPVAAGQSPVSAGRGHWIQGASPVSAASSAASSAVKKSSPGTDEAGSGSSGPPVKAAAVAAAKESDWQIDGNPTAPECKILPVKQVVTGGVDGPQSGSYMRLMGSSVRFPSVAVGSGAEATPGAMTVDVSLQDQPHYPPHFSRGSVIQLGTGQLKHVEDLQTSDFLESADFSPDLQVDSSTVVHMRQNHERNTVVLGFAVGKQSIQVTVEATLEHPFFVFGQGWSSYCPDKTLVRYGLQCRQLMVGNSCVSLTPREPNTTPVTDPASAIVTTTPRVNSTETMKLEPGEIPSQSTAALYESRRKAAAAAVTPPRRDGGPGPVKHSLAAQDNTKQAGRFITPSVSSCAHLGGIVGKCPGATGVGARRSPVCAGSQVLPCEAGVPRGRKRRRWSASDVRCLVESLQKGRELPRVVMPIAGAAAADGLLTSEGQVGPSVGQASIDE